MIPKISTLHHLLFRLLVSLALLTGAALLTTAGSQAAPAAQAGTTTLELLATDDARTQAGSEDVNFGTGALWIGTPEGHRSFVQFDLQQIPANAQIHAATLTLDFTGNNTGSTDVQIGVAEGVWDESTVTWNTQPTITWIDSAQPVEAAGPVHWNVTRVVQAWHDGSHDNHGFGVRGLAVNPSVLKAIFSKETDPTRGPTLLLTYTTPSEEAPERPDLGDAPDSTNHHGMNNTAYAFGAVLGQFPTVWGVPTGAVAGPRHNNATMEAFLGQNISREDEADAGPDQDGVNNILHDPITGAIVDVADLDRGDDGWRNRNIKFFHCQKQTLTVRVSKAQNATLDHMYLNVWFDGNRSGSWGDSAPCPPSEGAPNATAHEWIVQDQPIDLTVIPAGGYLDFPISTHYVLNTTAGNPHWMRFTLSEAPTEKPTGKSTGTPDKAAEVTKYPDGRGPHPDKAPEGYQYGETEDIFQEPPPPGEPGTLVLEKRVLNANEPVDWMGTVTYQIRLRHEGGTAPVHAEIRDPLLYPQHPDGTIQVTSSTGGASPLEASSELLFEVPDSDYPAYQVSWDGTLAPDAEVTLTFDVHVHPYCERGQIVTSVPNVAHAAIVGGSDSGSDSGSGDELTAEASIIAECYSNSTDHLEVDPDPIALPIDPFDLGQVSGQALSDLPADDPDGADGADGAEEAHLFLPIAPR